MKIFLTLIFVFFIFISLYLVRVDFFVSDNAEGKNNFSQNIQQATANLNAASFLNSNIETNGTSYKKCAVNIEAKSALIKFLNQNKNIFELNPDKHWSIASISKLMASIIAFEQIGANREIKITKESVESAGIAGDFKEGEIFNSLDLINAMLLVSSNDAAIALAQSIGEETFVKLMNQKALELKMSETIFFNPSGLSFLNQSTANDLVKLIGYIYNNHQEILDITKQKEMAITELGFKKTRNLVNINLFAGRNDFIGGKTGYLEESGRNLISLFNINNQLLLTIVLGAEDAHKETEKMISCI